MQNEPMVSVKVAADLLRLDKKSVRERLLNGQLSGVKKTIGSREKWFVHSAAVETLLEERRTQIPANTAPHIITATAVEDVENVEEAEEHRRDPSTFSRGQWYQEDRRRIDAIVEQMIKPLLDKCANQADVMATQEKTIEEQKLQLRLLPDLQADSQRAYLLQEEVLNLQQSNAETATALQKEIEQLKEKLNRPWWKKLLG